MKKTRLGPYFTGIVSAHDLGLPKEYPEFWKRLQGVIPYDPARTLLGEDSETNLATAQAFGIAFLIYMSRFSSTVSPRASARFVSIHYFNQLIPKTGVMIVEI
jgi:putative hydrolase of the HAD superfamily